VLPAVRRPPVQHGEHRSSRRSPRRRLGPRRQPGHRRPHRPGAGGARRRPTHSAAQPTSCHLAPPTLRPPRLRRTAPRDTAENAGGPVVSAQPRYGGYFIAEADPAAAHQAITRRYSRRHVDWAILATDGAADLLQHLGLDNWPAIAAEPTQASRLLRSASAWEAYTDPDGRQLPRAKRHDDKTLAVIREL